MKASGTDALGVLRWGLIRYSWILAACLLVGAALAPLVALNSGGVAEARALVVAGRIEVDLSAIPRYGEAVFNNGAVEEAVATEFGAGEVGEIIPDRVSLVAEQDSIVFGVLGRDPDPQTAADIANAAAATFTDALNSAGAGVGTFEVQTEAQVPPEPQPSLGTVYAIPVGIVAGLVLGLAVICVLLVLRRPVIEAQDAEDLTGIPALGTVAVPRTARGRFARPEEFDGLVPVCRRLLTLPTPTVVLVSRRRDEEMRMHLAVGLVGILRLAGRIQFVGPRRLGGDDEGGTGQAAAGRTAESGAPRLTVVDGGDLISLVQPPESTATVLVVREGISSSALRSAVVEHLGGSAEARLLLVRRGQRTRGQELTDPDVSDESRTRSSGAPVS
jgi:capsular polysaccharide biosynthesis protein